MSRASRIIVADADSKNAGLLAFGFEREGVEPVVVHAAADVPRMAIAGNVDGVVLSMPTAAQAVEALKGLRAAGPIVAKLPVLGLGETAARAEVLGAGAVDFLPRPNFVRDVVAMARFQTLRKPSSPTVWAGELGDFAGIFYLIRGLSSAQRTGVLTIVRSLRRAELRFYEGEVTSAQVGNLHGMAALHQVLLWTEGKLDFRAESVVRRQQIPLQPGELIDDLGRFLRDFHELAPDLGPGVVLEQDLRRVAECVDKIPKEVNPVLRLFDGARLLSDIVEDSPFRVFETVKIAARLVKLGALKPVVQARARGENSALKVDDWLVGSTPVQGVPAIIAARESEPVGPRPGVPASPPGAAAIDTSTSASAARQKKKAKKERERAAAAAPAAPPDGVVAQAVKPAASEPTDWGRLTGGASSVWDLPGYAPVVPSQVATGEISAITRPTPDANLAAASKVVAQDLFTAVQGVVRSIHGDSGPTPKVLVAEDAAVAPAAVQAIPAIRGKAAERVEDISAPVTSAPISGPVPVPVSVVPTLPGPAPVPVPVAPAVLKGLPVEAAPQPTISQTAVTVRTSQPLEASAPAEAPVAAKPAAPAPVAAKPAASAPQPAPAARPAASAPQPAPPVVLAPEPKPAPIVPQPSLPVVTTPIAPEPPVIVAPEVVDSRMHADGHEPDRNGVVSGVLSGALESRSGTPRASEPEIAEKIVVIDADFDPPRPPSVEPLRPPSVEIEIVRTIEADLPEGDTHIDQPAAPATTAAAASGTPVLRSIADEEPSDAAAARLPNVLVAPVGLAPVVTPPAAPEAVVVATPSAPTVQVHGAPPRVMVAPPEAETAIVPAAPAPVVPLPAPAVQVVPAAAVAPPPAAAAVTEEVTRSAADAATAVARALAFEAIEEDFFNQEHQFADAKAHPSESFDDLDGHGHGHRGAAPKRGFWSRLLGTPAPQPQRRARPTTAPPPTGSAGQANKTTGPQKTQQPQPQAGKGKKPQGGGGKKR